MKKTLIALLLILSCLGNQQAYCFEDERESEAHLIHSEILDEVRKVFVAVPQDYNPEKSYDLLVVLDADVPEFKDSLLGCEGVDLSNVIILGIANTVRERDMFPIYVGPRKPQSGKAEAFILFLLKEAIPMVEENWSVGSSRTIMGFSNSALFALYVMLEVPQAFDACISISPMIGYMPELMRDRANSLLRSVESFPKKIYIDQGSLDFERVVEFLPEYVSLLKSLAPKDLKLEYVIHEGYGHVPEISRCSGLKFVYPAKSN